MPKTRNIKKYHGRQRALIQKTRKYLKGLKNDQVRYTDTGAVLTVAQWNLLVKPLDDELAIALAETVTVPA